MPKKTPDSIKLQAMELFVTGNYTAKEIAEKKNDNQGLASIYNVLSILYKSQVKYVKSNGILLAKRAYDVELTNLIKKAIDAL